MKTIALILTGLGSFALFLVLDAAKLHIFWNPALHGFEATASVGAFYWLGMIVTGVGVLFCVTHLVVKKLKPWRSGAFVWCAAVLLGYGWLWISPP